jgi:hypothetical protein
MRRTEEEWIRRERIGGVEKIGRFEEKIDNGNMVV